MRLHHLIRRARIATIAAMFAAISVSAFGQNRTVTMSRFRYSRPPRKPPPAAQAESVRRLSIDEAVKLALEQNLGIRIQRIRSADSGHRRRAGAIVLGAEPARPASRRNSQTPAVHERALRQRDEHRSTARSSTGRRSTRRCRGARSYSATWNNSRFTTTNLFQQLQPAARLEPQPAVHAAAAAQLRDRSDPPAGRRTARRRASCPTSSSSGVITADAAQRQERVLGSVVRDQQPEGAAAVAGAVAAVAEGQPEARRDRHDGADRHRAGAGRSREQRAARDRRRGGDQGGAGQPARAHPRSRHAGFLERRRSSRPTRRRSPRRRSTSTRRCATRSTSGRTCAARRTASSRATSTSSTTATRSSPTSTPTSSYITTGVGGMQLSPVDLSAVIAGQPSTRTVVAERGFGSVLGDVFQSAYPNWTFGVSIGYPLGANTAQANLARVRLQYEQAQAQLKNLQMQVATQVRDVARNVQTNQQRVAVGARVARAAGEEARGRGKEARRRHVVELLRLPGAARSRAGAHRRNPGDLGLQQVAGRFRGRAAGAARRRWRRHYHRRLRRRRDERDLQDSVRRQRPGDVDEATVLVATSRSRYRLSPTRLLRLIRPAPIPSALPAPSLAPHVTLPECRSSRSPSSPKTKRRTSATRWRRSPGPTRSSSSTRAAPTRPSRSRGSTPIGSSFATGPDTSIRRTTPRRSPRHDWILSLDADERVTPELAAEIQACLTAAPREAAFRIPRVTWHLGRWIRTHRLVSRLPDAPVRSAIGANGPAATCTRR